MNILVVVAFSVIAAITSFVLKQIKPEFSTVVSILAICCVLVMLLSHIATVFEFVEQIFSVATASGEYIKILIKSAGICYISHLGSSICKECGQNTISKQIELVGKVSIILIALPTFAELLKVVANLSS